MTEKREEKDTEMIVDCKQKEGKVLFVRPRVGRPKKLPKNAKVETAGHIREKNQLALRENIQVNKGEGRGERGRSLKGQI